MEEHWVSNTSWRNSVVFNKDMIDSPAFEHLSDSAKIILLRLYRRLKTEKNKQGQWIVNNNGDIHMTYKELHGYGLKSNATCSKIIHELISHGFIEFTHIGSGNKGDCNLFALINKWSVWDKDNPFEVPTRNAVNLRKKIGQVVNDIDILNMTESVAINLPENEVF